LADFGRGRTDRRCRGRKRRGGQHRTANSGAKRRQRRNPPSQPSPLGHSSERHESAKNTAVWNRPRHYAAQTLRLEEHEDPNHPVVALATERIVELSTRKAAITDAIEALKGKRPGHHPDEIVAMLDAVPDLRPTIATATDEQLAEIFRAFDVSIL
jgi:hypothetical protein